MNSSELTLEQLERTLARAEADLGFYARLVERMRDKKLGDQFIRTAERVHGELQAWRMQLHYELISRRRQEDGWTK